MTNPLQLGYWESNPNRLEKVRALTEGEIATSDKFAPIYAEVEERMSLFRILGLNYDAWQKFTNSLLSARPNSDDDKIIANQLLLNLLTTGYSITEHFNVSFRHRFKKDAAKLRDYEDFLQRLYTGSWATAFFFDFRDYVQHRGLPVGRYNRTVNRTKVEVTIAQDAEVLLKEHRRWERSNLNANHGKLDLVDLSFGYFLYLKRDYAAYVAKTFYPELVEIQEFFSRLTAEATDGQPRTKDDIYFQGRRGWQQRHI